MIETDRAERTDEVKRNWTQVKGPIYQILERYDEELVELEVRIERLDGSISLGEEASNMVRERHVRPLPICNEL